MHITGGELLQMFGQMRPVPDVGFMLRRVEHHVGCPTETDLDVMPFPQPSPFKSWGQYMDYKRKAGNFPVTEKFNFGALEIRRTGHRTFRADDGYLAVQLTGQSDKQAIDNLIQLMSNNPVKASETLLH